MLYKNFFIKTRDLIGTIFDDTRYKKLKAKRKRLKQENSELQKNLSFLYKKVSSIKETLNKEGYKVDSPKSIIDFKYKLNI